VTIPLANKDSAMSDDIRQIDVQNALRVLCRMAQKGESIEFRGGDLVDIDGQLYRTQEAAERLCDYDRDLHRTRGTV
jgi:hypothetical protein